MEYTPTSRVDLCETVCQLVEKLRGLSEKYLKCTTYVDNNTSVFPLLKELTVANSQSQTFLKTFL